MSKVIQILTRLVILGVCLLSTLSAHAVGLGKLRVQSALDQPLSAEIELLSTTPAELNTLKIGLGSRSDFRRGGVERSTVLSLIKFESALRDDGNPYIKVSSQEPITEPFLHFLITLEWAGGRLIREYTALLDPPLYAQGRPASVSSPRIAGSAPSGAQVVAPVPGSAPSVIRPAPQPASGDLYGPINRGETLSGIVGRMNLPAGADVFQAMFALLQKNPGAFIYGNINLLKEGSTLNLPSAEEIASISKVVASAEYTKHLNEWFSFRNQVASAAVSRPGVTTTGVSAGAVEPQPLDPGVDPADAALSEDVLRILQTDADRAADGQPGTADNEEMNALKSQLVVMEESLLSTELENKELRDRLAVLEQQIRETNKLLKVDNAGLALAENNARQQNQAQDTSPAADTGASAGGAVVDDAAETQSASGRVRTTRKSSSFDVMAIVDDLMKGDMLWKLLLGLAAIVLLIGIIVYVRRRRSYAEFEETMMTGSTYDLRGQTSAYTQMPNMDTVQHSQPSVRYDSQSQHSAPGSLMQTSFMTEMGAPGMGAMQADEVDPIAEAEVYMAYGRDQQAMEVLQDAIRRDPGRNELKIKLLEVYQKRKDVRAFEALAEELYSIIGKDPAKWGRVTEMGCRVSPKHPLFAAAAGSGMTAEATTTRSTGSIDRDSSGLDLISAPFSRSSASVQQAAVGGAETIQPMGGGLSLGEDSLNQGPMQGFDLDSVSVPLSGSLNVPSEPASGVSAQVMQEFGSEAIDDFKASEIATKLDLAKAYMEMGDREAARGFLDEVLKEGNDAQRQQASELASNF